MAAWTWSEYEKDSSPSHYTELVSYLCAGEPLSVASILIIVLIIILWVQTVSVQQEAF